MFDMQLFQNIVLHPKASLVKLKKVDLKTGIRYALTTLGVLLLVNLVFTILLGLIEGKDLVGASLLSILGSISLIIMTTVALVFLGYISGLISVKIFKAKGLPSKTAGLTCYAAAIVLALGILTNFIALLFTLLGGSFLSTLAMVNGVLALVSLVLTLYIADQAALINHNLGAGKTAVIVIVSTVITLFLTALVNVPVAYVIGALAKALALA